MDLSSVGVATAWAQTRAAAAQQAIGIAMLRERARSEQSLVHLLEKGVEAGKSPPAAGQRQGGTVDIRI
jgi:hypothetical protein